VLNKNKLPFVPESNKESICDACQKGKSHQLPYPKSTSVSRAPLELVFSDVWGPDPTSVGKNNFYVSFIDDYSKFTWIYLLWHKSEAFQRFHDFQNIVERMFDRKIVAMQTDWGGEYQNSILFSNALAFRIMCLAHMHINKMAQPNASIGILLKLVFPFLLTPPCPSSFGMRL